MQFARKLYALLTTVERRYAFFLLGMMLLGVVLETFSISLVIPALAIMAQQNIESSLPVISKFIPKLIIDMDTKQLLLIAMVFLVFIHCVKAFFLGWLAWCQSSFAFTIQTRLSRQLLSTYLCQPYSFHLNQNSAQLIFNTTTGITYFAGSIQHGLAFFTELLIILALSILLITVEPLGTFIILSIFGLIALLMHYATANRNTKWGKNYQYHEGMRIQHIQQALGGVKDILLLGRAENFILQFSKHNDQSARMATYQNTLQNLPRLALETLSIGALAGLVFVLLWQGKPTVAILPTIGLFATAAFRLMPSVNRILLSLQSLKYHKSMVDTVYDELSNTTKVFSLKNQSFEKLNFQKEITIQSVSYKYAGASQKALSEISFNINKGTSIGFIGTSGSGKTTLIDILLGLLTPEKGQICVDGCDMQLNLQGWQQQIGYVPQTIFLTDDSLKQNIALGIAEHEIDDDAVTKALAAAQLTDFVNNLPEGINTKFGERGVRLSGGQRQRIGIARALYHDPEILVLDEATSALDAVTEAEVMQAIYALNGKKTVIIVAHRTSTVAQCDHIYRLNHGVIVMHGSPQQVL